MNFFRTLRHSRESWEDLKHAMLSRRAAQDSRYDIPSEQDLVAFVHSLSDDDFHKVLVISGAMMAKARGYDVFNLPHPPT